MPRMLSVCFGFGFRMGVLLCSAALSEIFAAEDRQSLVAAVAAEDAERADVDGDLHWSSIQQYLQEPIEPMRHEVLLVGDGEKMRFWPMWPFYRWFHHARKPPHSHRRHAFSRIDVIFLVLVRAHPLHAITL